MNNILINPYNVGPPVKGSDFYGRVDLLDRVIKDLHDSNVILLQGQRRIGKTSFLHQLQSLLTSKGFLPVFFDIQNYVGDNLPQFQEHLALAIAKKLQLQVPKLDEWESNNTLFLEIWLPRVFDVLGSRELVILVDEFDNLGERNDRPVETLVTFIAGLVKDELRLKWSFIIGRHIGKLPIQYDPIAVLARKHFIGRFTFEESKELIVTPVLGILTYDDATVEHIFQLTSGQPHLTQALCFEVFNYVILDKRRNTANIEDVDAVISHTLQTYEGAIASIARVPAIEESVMAAIAKLTVKRQTTSRNDIVQLLLEHRVSLELEELTNTLNRLVEWDLLIREGELVRPAIKLVGIWIAKKISLEPSREKVLDILKARAENRYEFAEKARHEGMYDYAIQDYNEALKHVPLHKGALRGLAEIYKITEDFEKRAITLKKLYRIGSNILPELIEALVDYAQRSEKREKYIIAAEQYEKLIKLQDNVLWRQGLTRTLLKEAEKHDELAEAKRVIEYGLAIIPGKPEAQKLEKKLDELKYRERIISLHEKAEVAEKQGNWEAAAEQYKALIKLQDDILWRYGLVRTCLKDAEMHLVAAKKIKNNAKGAKRFKDELANARNIIEYGLAVIPGKPEAQKLEKKLEELELKEIIISMHEKAEVAEKNGNLEDAAELYEALIKLQDDMLWRQGLARIHLHMAKKHLIQAQRLNNIISFYLYVDNRYKASMLKLKNEFAAARQATERGLVFISEGQEAEQLKKELEIIKHVEWIISMSELAETAEKQGNWETAAKHYEVLINKLSRSYHLNYYFPVVERIKFLKQRLVKVRLQEAIELINRDQLTDAKRTIERGLAIVSNGPEAQKLKMKLEELQQKDLTKYTKTLEEVILGGGR